MALRKLARISLLELRGRTLLKLRGSTLGKLSGISLLKLRRALGKLRGISLLELRGRALCNLRGIGLGDLGRGSLLILRRVSHHFVDDRLEPSSGDCRPILDGVDVEIRGIQPVRDEHTAETGAEHRKLLFLLDAPDDVLYQLRMRREYLLEPRWAPLHRRAGLLLWLGLLWHPFGRRAG
jgi:hypothetical protein